MGGILSDHRRDAALERLRKAAINVIGLRGHLSDAIRKNAYDRQRRLMFRLIDALGDLVLYWRDFPENERDAKVPGPMAILRMCESYDRQKAEAERLKAREASV